MVAYAAPLRFTRGVTLIELMIGIAVVALLLMMAAPMSTTWSVNSQIRTASESIQNGLQLARSEALSRNARVLFTLGDGTSWSIGCGQPTTSCPETIQSRPSGEGSAAAVYETAPGEARTVTFSNLGQVLANSDGSATVSQIDVRVPDTVLAPSERRDLRIVVGVGGSIRMCDPQRAAPDARAC